MFVTHLKLINWKNFRKINADFQDITYITGPNASGKSNLLDVFCFLRDIANPNGGSLLNALNSRGGFSQVCCLAAEGNPNILIDVSLTDSFDESPKWEYILEISQESTGKRLPFVSMEKVIDLRNQKIVLERPDGRDRCDKRLLSQTALEQISQNGKFRDVADFFADVLFLNPVPQFLKFKNELTGNRMENDPFGQGLLETIALTPEKVSTARLRRIESVLKEAILGMSNLIFERDGSGSPHLKMKFKHHKEWQSEEEFSDGMLRMIAFLWMLFGMKNLTLFEEPELSLHQDIVEKIPELILRVGNLRKNSGGQIFISTHSNEMLSSPVIRGQWLVLKPGDGNKGTEIAS